MIEITSELLDDCILDYESIMFDRNPINVPEGVCSCCFEEEDDCECYNVKGADGRCHCV